eukprot:scaffold1177_cov79-Cylindrotheca_fusiformis.AAC.4
MEVRHPMMAILRSVQNEKEVPNYIPRSCNCTASIESPSYVRVLLSICRKRIFVTGGSFVEQDSFVCTINFAVGF